VQIVVTGATGFIGSRLTLRCLEQGHVVKALGRENNPAEAENSRLIRERGAEVFLEPITNREAMLQIVQNVDVVFHMAAAQHEANVPDRFFRDVNVEGTRNILDASVTGKVKRFVHGSTIGVYGSSGKGPIDEHCPLEPNNIYEVTKLEAEEIVNDYGKRLPTVIARISETYGPGDRRLLKLFKGIQKNVILIIGRGKNLHHLIYIDDLIEGLLLAADSEEAKGKTFLFVGKEAVETQGMVAEVARQLEARGPVIRLPLTPFLVLAVIMEATCRPLGIQPPLHRRRMDFFRKSFNFSGTEAREVLGFVPKTDLAEGVAATLRWYREEDLL